MARYKKIFNISINKISYPEALANANIIAKAIDMPVHDAIDRILAEKAKVIKEQASKRNVSPSDGASKHNIPD